MVPEDDELERRAEAYLEHLLGSWRWPLQGVEPERFGDRTYTSKWGREYSIGAMLEHAVAHPMRHGLQLEEWLAAQRPGD